MQHRVSVLGIDPGIVTTGAVYLELDSSFRHVITRYEAFDGIKPDSIKEAIRWTQRLPYDAVFIEAYRPRSHFSVDADMVVAVNRLKSLIPNSRALNNTGVTKVIKPHLLQALQVWRFPTKTHHQDLRSAARIALYGLVKNPEWNPVLAAFITDLVDGKPWKVN